jgi:hypothetical protein
VTEHLDDDTVRADTARQVSPAEMATASPFSVVPDWAGGGTGPGLIV